MPNFQYNIKVNGNFLGFIDGQQCKSLPAFYSHIARALDFPDYFGNNLDALDEALCDLNWIEEETVLLVIFNYNQFMSEDKENLQVINAIFSHAISELEAKEIYFTVLTQQF